MIKISKTELFKGFILYESIFVALPLTVMGFTIFELSLIYKYTQPTSSTTHFYFFILLLHIVSNLISLYFVLPGLTASKLFRATTIGFIPKSFAAWIITIGIYSLIALFVAIIMSLYKPSQKQKDPAKGYLINPIRKKLMQID